MVTEIVLEQPGKRRFVTGDALGFLLILKGSGHIVDQGKVGPETLLLCKPGQRLELEFNGGRVPLKGLWVCLSADQIRKCSTEKTDLLAGFARNPVPVALVQPHSNTLMLIKSLAMQLEHSPEGQYAGDVVVHATMQMFLAMVLQSFVAEDPYCPHPAEVQKSQFSLDEVFRYIHTHLTEELSLEILEKEFYVSRSHLIREFKKRTGQTVHSYIVRARLDLCRTYIEQGYSITEASRMGGFGSYNHFFKAFRKAYGMTPKEYYRSVQKNLP